MKKKLSTLLAAMAVVAFAVPTASSANTPTLFDHSGQVAVGAKILATSTNWSMLTSFGNLTCAKVTITSRVTNNSAGTVRMVGEGSGTASTCAIFTITDITVTEVHTAAAGSGTINLTFKADGPSGLVCHFASASIPFIYTVGVTNDTISIQNGNFVGTPAACEPGLVNAAFTLETDVSPFAPVWFQ